MNVLRRSLSLVLAFVLVLSIMVVSASAATVSSVNWYEVFRSFPELYNGSTMSGYIKMLQRFLLVYPVTYSSIYNANSSYGGVDGGFGDRTLAAVKLFQRTVLGIGQDDGYVGPKTWGAIYSKLTLDPNYNIFKYNGIAAVSDLNCNVIRCVNDTAYSRVCLGSYNHQNTPFNSYFCYIY